MTATNLSGWLRAKPSLAGIRVDGDDRRIVRIAGRQYGHAERAILDMGGEKLEGLDASGAVLRTLTLKRAPGDALAPPAKTETAWPEGEQSQLARVITLACDASAARHEAVFRMAFDKLSALYEQQSARLGALEHQWFDDMRSRVDEAERRAEAAERYAAQLQAEAAEAPSEADGLANVVVQAAVGKLLSPASSDAPPNGAKHQ